jgi:hypothetical protein
MGEVGASLGSHLHRCHVAAFAPDAADLDTDRVAVWIELHE